MVVFTKSEFTTISNPEYDFYKLYINGECPFDEFEKEICKNETMKKRLKHIYSMMDNFSSHMMLPKTKFRHIEGIDDKAAGKGMKRSDIYEFKKDDIRVYVLKASPDFFLILGGVKGTQKKDLARLNALLDNLIVHDIRLHQERIDNI